MRRIKGAVVVARILSNRLMKLINIRLQCILRADQQYSRISRDIDAFFFLSKCWHVYVHHLFSYHNQNRIIFLFISIIK
jgi:flagellar biosynthesis regulator FlaF